MIIGRLAPACGGVWRAAAGEWVLAQLICLLLCVTMWCASKCLNICCHMH
jgi:uncharacterized membrane protein YccF (DUF307 family)